MSATTQNKRLEYFKSQIDKSFEMGPSPVGRWLGGILRDVTPESITIEFTVRPDMTNPMGTIHGGIAATMMDDTIGALTFAYGREYAYTSVNLNCDFLKAAVPNDVLTAHAQVIRAGRNIIHCECKITNQDSKIIAKSSSNMIQTHVKLPF